MRTLLVAALTVLVAFSGCLDDDDRPSSPTAPAFSDPVDDQVVVHTYGGRLLDLGTVDLSMAPRFEERYVGDRGAGEPTIAVNGNGVAIFPSIEFDAVDDPSGVVGSPLARTVLFRSSDQGVTWEDVSPDLQGQQAQPTSLDPYVYADPVTGRLFTMDLYVGCSNLSWSDDDGDTWTTNPVACGVPVNDHQTLFSGPPVAPLTTVGYSQVLYYCNNQIAQATCAHSLDGGLSWTNGGPVFAGAQANADDDVPAGFCGSLHGHGRANHATGAVYIPKNHCGEAWVSVSEDNGVTWTPVLVDATVGISGDPDPAVAADAAGNVYYVWLDRDELPQLAISRDNGFTWDGPYAVGHPNVTAAKFPAVVAGDEGRVSILYLGTQTPSGFDADKEETKNTTWEFYLATTFDALSPEPVIYTTYGHDREDPVRRGRCDGRCQSQDGGMYDFLDIDIDPTTGRVWAAMVDMCHDECLTDIEAGGEALRARGSVAVQVGGETLRADTATD